MVTELVVRIWDDIIDDAIFVLEKVVIAVLGEDAIELVVWMFEDLLTELLLWIMVVVKIGVFVVVVTELLVCAKVPHK